MPYSFLTQNVGWLIWNKGEAYSSIYLDPRHRAELEWRLQGPWTGPIMEKTGDDEALKASEKIAKLVKDLKE